MEGKLTGQRHPTLESKILAEQSFRQHNFVLLTDLGEKQFSRTYLGDKTVNALAQQP